MVERDETREETELTPTRFTVTGNNFRVQSKQDSKRQVHCRLAISFVSAGPQSPSPLQLDARV